MEWGLIRSGYHFFQILINLPHTSLFGPKSTLPSECNNLKGESNVKLLQGQKFTKI